MRKVEKIIAYPLNIFFELSFNLNYIRYLIERSNKFFIKGGLLSNSSNY